MTQREEWKAIPGFSRYQASNTGHIRSTNYKRSGRIVVLTPAIGKDGYPQTMVLSDSGKYETHKIHWFVTLAFFGQRSDGREVNHKNGIKTDNRIENLEYVTRRENMDHSLRNKLQKKFVCGSEHGQAKLNEEQVREIRHHAAISGKHYGRKQLAEKYGISEAHIKDIVTQRRNVWRFV